MTILLLGFPLTLFLTDFSVKPSFFFWNCKWLLGSSNYQWIVLLFDSGWEYKLIYGLIHLKSYTCGTHTNHLLWLIFYFSLKFVLAMRITLSDISFPCFLFKLTGLYLSFLLSWSYPSLLLLSMNKISIVQSPSQGLSFQHLLYFK